MYKPASPPASSGYLGPVSVATPLVTTHAAPIHQILGQLSVERGWERAFHSHFWPSYYISTVLTGVTTSSVSPFLLSL